MKIANWSAKRSGPTLTVTGVNLETGRPVKVTGVEEIIAAQYPSTEGAALKLVDKAFDAQTYELV